MTEERKQLSQEAVQYIAKRIRDGTLVDEKVGMEGLYKELEEQFKDRFKSAGKRLTKKWFNEQVENLFWTEGKDGTLAALKEIVKRGVPTKRFQRHHSYIPLKMVEKKARELRGMTTTQASAARFLRGTNRIEGPEGLETIDDFEVPKTSPSEPFTVEVKDVKNWCVMIINGANVGIKYPGTMEDNPVRQALSNAERAGCDAVFLTNAIDMDMTKAAGPLKALRGLFSGRNINVGLLDPSYQDEASRILRDMPNDELIYETANEAFENLVSGWRKIACMPKQKPFNGKPEFSGPVYIVFGYKEEDYVATATYWKALYHTNCKRHEIVAELKAAGSALAKAMNEGTREEQREKEREVERLMKQEARTRITPVTPEEWQRFFPMTLAHFISRFENAIPNSKVIGVNTTHVVCGENSIELYIPDHLRVADTLLSNRVGNHGPSVLRETCADMTVVCHPYALNARVTARERDAKGRRGHAYFAVAPICVDADFLRDAYKSRIRKAHPIGRVVYNEQCHTGSIMLECAGGRLQLPATFSVGSLAKYRLYKKDFENEAKGKRRVPLMEHPHLKYIWYWIFTDPHVGSRNRETVWCKELQARLGMFEATAHLMRRDGLLAGNRMPIHIASSNDDIVHGNHFGTHLQPHPQELSYMELEDLWREKMKEARGKRSRTDILQLFAEMQELVLYQIQIRGIDWTANQMQEAFERLIAPNVDVFDAILGRAKKSGLVVRGISELRGDLKDTRDIGLINIGTGNHFEKTVDRTLVEGPIFAKAIQAELAALPKWRDKRALLKQMIRAPLDGKRFIGYGTVQAPNGYEWGFDMRDTPTGGIDWNDPLKATVKKEMRRGNPSRILEGKMTVRSYGDKHFLNQIITDWGLFVMGAPGTHTDLFGEFGFPPNNTGVTFVGLPVDGPDGGPILLRALLFDDIKHFVESGEPIEWERLLPNPA